MNIAANDVRRLKNKLCDIAMILCVVVLIVLVNDIQLTSNLSQLVVIGGGIFAIALTGGAIPLAYLLEKNKSVEKQGVNHA